MTPELRQTLLVAPERGKQETEAAQAYADAGDEGQEGEQENQAVDGDSCYVGILG
ncbi:hypothetical protein [Pseudoduganella flava]|uniref:Uncharacterized protein n=1 Tax=Pseudoduganella flava TaxID=871742 RepID=A0ABX6FQB9_9BURK|nr:hypothetical protein [Pseudoduganella flava]QGZ39510.1 hypothetical protein GO485_10930 [Pseudoduganella flava]